MQLNYYFQLILPKAILSRLLGKIAHSKRKWLKTILIKWFIKYYKIDLRSVIKTNIDDYPTFNSFFIRELRPELRPIVDGEKNIVSPCDGKLSQFGQIVDGKMIQAKGFDFQLSSLLGLSLKDYVNDFINGDFATIYLSPRDYHRVHIPYQGKLLKMVHVPGRLFAVNKKSANSISDLFARNERVISVFETSFGLMAVVLVGAMLVAGIETPWHGLVTPNSDKINAWDYSSQNLIFKKGDEIGRFIFGSTVIVLFPQSKIIWPQGLRIGDTVNMGQSLAYIGDR